MTNLQNTVKRLGIIVFRKYFAADHQGDILELLLWNSQQTPLWPTIWPISKTLSQVFYSPFSAGLVVRIMCTSFGVLTVKFLLNQITTHKMASLESIVANLRIIVLCYSYSAYHQNDNVELLPWNCQLTPLCRKRYPICKILSHAPNYRFHLVIWCLSSERQFGAISVKFSQNCITA